MENRSPNDRGDFIMENIDNDKLLDDIIAFLDGSAAKGAAGANYQDACLTPGISPL